jgi:GDP-L-fucose synthase
MCQAYRKQYGFNAICLMPSNLYGPGDNFALEHSHVLPALILKFHVAKQTHQDQVIVWGTGKPKREFLYVDDLAETSVHLMQTYDSSDIVNVGVGKDISISSDARSRKVMKNRRLEECEKNFVALNG